MRALVIGLAAILSASIPAHADRVYVPDYSCAGPLDPDATSDTPVCSVKLPTGRSRVDVLMPFAFEGSWSVRIDASGRLVAVLSCRIVEGIGGGSSRCGGGAAGDAEMGTTSGLLWADGYMDLKVPAGSVLTLSAGRGYGAVSVRGRSLAS